MAIRPELRSRVERVLAGDYRAEDFTRLFLGIRERSYGAASVREIGDFVAHADEKNKGLVTSEASDFFVVLRVLIPALKNPIDLAKPLPPRFGDALRANFRRLDAVSIRQRTGMKRQVAQAVLADATKKLISDKSTGQLRVAGQWTRDEQSIIECCCSFIISNPAFTDEDLIRDISFVLTKNGILSENEKADFKKATAALSLYALSTMHGVEMVLDDGTRAPLSGGVSYGKLQVTADAPCITGDGKSIRVGGPMFDTKLEASEWCDAQLVSTANNYSWTAPIEYTFTGKPMLVPL